MYLTSGVNLTADLMTVSSLNSPSGLKEDFLNDPTIVHVTERLAALAEATRRTPVPLLKRITASCTARMEALEVVQQICQLTSNRNNRSVPVSIWWKTLSNGTKLDQSVLPEMFSCSILVFSGPCVHSYSCKKNLKRVTHQILMTWFWSFSWSAGWLRRSSWCVLFFLPAD